MGEDVDFAVGSLAARQAILGIDPRLILVVEVGSNPGVSQESAWELSGLRVVDTTASKRVVAFSDDPAMEKFKERLAEYANGVKEGQVSASYESFFDNIISVRPYDARDRVGIELAKVLAKANASEVLAIDVEVWYPGNVEIAKSWITDLREAIEASGNEVHDEFVSDSSGLALMRVSATAAIVKRILHVDLVARAEVLPGSLSVNTSASDLSAVDIADLPVPASDAPIIGMIDSGVNANHPLLRDCVVDAFSVSSWIADGADRHGHGTAVASLLLRGSLEGQIADNDWETPPCRVLSVRVLDEHNQISSFRLAEHEIADAAAALAARGVKVINLSLGDLNGMIVGNRVPSIAAMLDSLSRRLGVVFVVPTGTVAPREYAGTFDAALSADYPKRMLDSAATGLIDPAPAATALTVGALVPSPRALPLGTVPLGRPGWPAPFSRVGPGVGEAVKPELVAPAGTLAQDQESGALLEPNELKVAVADGRLDSSGLITYDFGSSLAAPLVSRIAAVILEKYPDASSNLIRSLILQSTSPAKNTLAVGEKGDTETALERKTRLLLGYGQASSLRSAESGLHDMVLIAEDEIVVDGVHLYAIPVPSAFFEHRRAVRGISICLSFDPPVRARRADYLSNKMNFELLRGIPARDVIDMLLAETRDSFGARVKIPNQRNLKLAEVSKQKRLEMVPSQTVRSWGTNQVGRRVWQTALPRFNDFPNDFLVAVQSQNRWAKTGFLQSYALTVRLWVDERLPPVYEEVRGRIQAAQARARGRARG
ncbi:S8 family peptidase [Streptomyces olivaceoviridis]|uniref:S8 family peptidase n=1 Tax=Streptomyces olivaceoviridis TaxID=1921 RepID=UPI00332BCF1A